MNKYLEVLKEDIKRIKIQSSTVIAFDFDELIVPIHLARTITDKISKPLDLEKLNKLGHSSIEGIEYIHEQVKGYNYEKYKDLRNKVAKETPFREGFKELLIELMKTYTVVTISAGLKDVCYAKLKEINFPKENCLGGEYEVENNIISGSKIILTDEMKGLAIKELNTKTIAIGHSEGDRIMLDAADISIALNNPDLAQYNVQTAEEIKKIIEEYEHQDL
jgi:phosphoserine phosphatase